MHLRREYNPRLSLLYLNEIAEKIGFIVVRRFGAPEGRSAGKTSWQNMKVREREV